MGMSVEAIANHRLRKQEAVARQTFEAAQRVLDEAQANGEDGWDTNAARVAHLDRVQAGVASGAARRAKADKPQIQDWQEEMAMDAAYCQARWAYDAIENGWPLADFEEQV
jgi:hypothetical protein